MKSQTDKTYSPQDITLAWQLIQKSKKITLLTHHKPDADGVSACAALDHLLARLGKTTEAIYPTAPESNFSHQPKIVLINQHHQIPDLIIICDTANNERRYQHDALKNIPIINIDHHISNSIIGAFNFLNANASSACEELFYLLKQWCPDMIDTYVAECLLLGILYDSQVFHTQSTTATTLRVAADLMDYGVNLFTMKSELLTHKNPKIISLWGKVLNNIKISPTQKAVWAIITQQDLKNFGVDSTALIGFSNFLCELSGIDITIVFYEVETGQIKASLRSKQSDVNLLASKFGGGGHRNASAILSNKPMDQFVKEVTKDL
jgi:phosphoesterase RecJ-like protein